MISKLLDRAQQGYGRVWRGPLTQLQYRLLDHLQEAGDEVVQSSVIDAIVTDRSTLSEMCVRLEKDRLIYRNRDAHDHRKILIGVTDKGRGKWRMCKSKIRQIEDEFLAVFDKKDRALFIELLTELAHAH